ncbi:MAG: phosphoribosylglycinamide formyltransferase [Aureispira sp.]|nr:phosphoribosylglycinamide formyltransferase [Aureispira sp.]
MKKIAIFISGRGSNMKAILEQCNNGVLQNVAQPILVFSNNPEAAGLETAKSYGIPTASIPSKGKKRVAFDQEVIDFLENYDIDYIVLAGYMRVLSKRFVQAFKNKIINIHPADTHQHKGLHAYEWAYNSNLKHTKITVHYVDEGVDTGNIIAQAVVNLEGAKTLEDIEKRGLAVEHRFYSQTLAEVMKA